MILQVLIGRDGTVQDAKFLQGSLAFAKSAIDGVKAWKFKPYVMNGRPVSVQTPMTISFKPVHPASKWFVLLRTAEAAKLPTVQRVGDLSRLLRLLNQSLRPHITEEAQIKQPGDRKLHLERYN